MADDWGLHPERIQGTGDPVARATAIPTEVTAPARRTTSRSRSARTAARAREPTSAVGPGAISTKDVYAGRLPIWEPPCAGWAMTGRRGRDRLLTGLRSGHAPVGHGHLAGEVATRNVLAARRAPGIQDQRVFV